MTGKDPFDRIRSAAALWPFAVLWAVFFWPLLTLHSSFVRSDYMAQHVPWGWAAFSAIRAGSLPFWTPLMGGGFPLFAEGQAAALYLPHWLAYKTLPFLTAYTWSVPLHFAVGGVGMFVYARRLGLSGAAAGWAAACFAFGSGYAGCFLNTASLRVACWIPLALWLLDRARQMPPAKALAARLALALIISQQWTAGASQMAVYTFGYYAAHELAAGWEERRWRGLLGLGGSLALGSWMALAQIAPSMELIGHSVRQGEGAAFALWGSVPPIAPFLLPYPEWGNSLRYCFYLGVAPLLFILALFILERPRPFFRHAALAVLFFALALGRFNPVYVWAVEHLQLTLLRNPAKFLFFTATSLSVLAGCGLDAVIRAAGDRVRGSRAARWVAVCAGGIALMPAAGQAALTAARPFWAGYRDWYVDRLIAEKGALAKAPEYYFGLMDRFFDGLRTLFSYRNPFTLQTVGLAAAAALIVWFFLNGRIRERRFVAVVSVALVWDLFLFAQHLGTGFLGNIGPVKDLEPSAWTQGVREEAARDPDPLRAAEPARVAEMAERPADYQLTPNYQMYHGLAHAGGYSPLLIKRYHELVYDLGVSDGSLGMPPVSADVWKRQRGVVDLIGARYLSTDAAFTGTGWTLLRTARDHRFSGSEAASSPLRTSVRLEAVERRLYRNDAATPALWTVRRWEVVPEEATRLERLKHTDFDPRELALLEREPEGSGIFRGAGEGHAASEPADAPQAGVTRVRLLPSGAAWEAEATGPGLVATRITNYPGWRLTIDGQAAKILSANHAFIGFWTGPGAHRIQLEYQPTHWRLWVNWTLAGWALWGLAVLAAAVLWARGRVRDPF